MKTSTKYSVSDAATLYKKSRATLYKDIKNGVLSRDHDGSIDFSELLRVYGEPFGRKHSKHIETSPIQTANTPEYTENTVSELRNQIDFLKKQLEKAEDREAKANSRIDTLLTLIEMKPTKVHPTPDQSEPSHIDPVMNIYTNKYDGLTTKHDEIEKRRTSLPDHVEPEAKKRGFLSRFFLPNG